MRRYILILPALLALALVACGEENGGTPAGTSSTPEATMSEATPEPTPTTPPAPTATEATEATADAGRGEIASLFESFMSTDFTVTYHLDGTVEGEAFEGDWTWYQDASGERLRMDIDGSMGEMPLAVTVINTVDETLICTDGACMRIGADGSSPFPDPSELLAGQVMEIETHVLDSGSVRLGETRTVAGVDTQCFEFEGTEAADPMEGVTCVSADGIPLYTQWEGPEGSFLLEATSYSDSLNDADFEAPFPVMSFP